jgi:hypothetical protein
MGGSFTLKSILQGESMFEGCLKAAREEYVTQHITLSTQDLMMSQNIVNKTREKTNAHDIKTNPSGEANH